MVFSESVALLVARRTQQSTNDRKVAGSRPVCITVLTGNCMGWTARCGRPSLLPSCRKLEFRLSALMDSDLAWVNGKSGRHNWRYADAFQSSIISEAIYYFIYDLINVCPVLSHVHLVLTMVASALKRDCRGRRECKHYRILSVHLFCSRWTPLPPVS